MAGIKNYRIEQDQKLRLSDFAPDDDGGLPREEGESEFFDLHQRLVDLAELLYADDRYGLLVVLQGMDTSGKDSATRAVFGGISPTGIDAVSFKAPNSSEADHDFLWRIHQHAPPRGQIALFNRSHYEDVLIVRVKNLVPEERWKRRYEHINAFERMLSDENTVIVKFFLHIGKDFQKRRLEKRLANPKKHWKFDPNDIAERGRWDQYQEAYADALRKCSTPHAPWYIIPAEKRWYRDLLMSRVLVKTLESLNLKYPQPTFDPAKIVIP